MRLRRLISAGLAASILVGCGGGGVHDDDGGYLEGFLSSSDWVLGDGFYSDRYVFIASRDGTVQVDMAGTQVDPYLVIIDEDGNYIEDDDSGPGDDARLEFQVRRGETFEVRTTTYDTQDTGGYGLYWSRGLVLDGELRGRAEGQEPLRAPQRKPKGQDRSSVQPPRG